MLSMPNLRRLTTTRNKLPESSLSVNELNVDKLNNKARVGVKPHSGFVRAWANTKN